MSYLKFSPNLFLESQELKRLDFFLRDKGYEAFLKGDTIKWGIINNVSDSSFNGFKITDAGLFTNDTINVASGVAIGFDSFNQKVVLSVNEAQKQIVIPTTGAYYWVIVKPTQTPFEVGVCTVNPNGTVAGVETKFLDVLRGQPNFPSVISFQKTDGTPLLNDKEYTILEVDDDNNIILQGSFVSESNLIYKVIGTFTPGFIPATEEKDIFQYDSSIIELQLVNGFTPPTLDQNIDFLLGKVRRTGSIIEINDYRSDSIYKNRSEYKAENLDLLDNVLLGVEKVQYGDPASTLDSNIISISHGFKTDNFSYDLNQNKITINGGNGGRYKNTTFFVNGDFNSWRVYIFNSNTNRYYKINNSVKSGSSIILSLDTIHKDDFSYQMFDIALSYSKNDIVQTISTGFFQSLILNNIGYSPDSVSAWDSLTTYSTNELVRKGDKVYRAATTTVGEDPETNANWTAIWKQFVQELLIVPDADSIEYSLIPASSENLSEDSDSIDQETVSRLTVSKVFKINTESCKISALAFSSPSCFYNLRYRYINNSNYSGWKLPKSDLIGYVDEDGENYPISSEISFYFGYIRVKMSPNSYSNTIEKVFIGDKKGITKYAFPDTNLIDLAVGRDEEWQLIEDGSTFTTGSDFFINLKTFVDSPNFNTVKPKDGNRFFIQIRQNVVLTSGAKIIIKQNVNPLTPSITGTILRELNSQEISVFTRDRGLLIIFTYDSETDTWLDWNQIVQDIGDKYKTLSTTPTSFTPISALNTVKIFPTPNGMSYSSGVRLRATSTLDPNDWVEGVVDSYSGNNVAINIDVTSGTATSTSGWLLNIGGSNSFIMNNKVYASAANVGGNFQFPIIGIVMLAQAGGNSNYRFYFDDIYTTVGFPLPSSNVYTSVGGRPIVPPTEIASSPSFKFRRMTLQDTSGTLFQDANSLLGIYGGTPSPYIKYCLQSFRGKTSFQPDSQFEKQIIIPICFNVTPSDLLSCFQNYNPDEFSASLFARTPSTFDQSGGLNVAKTQWFKSPKAASFNVNFETILDALRTYINANSDNEQVLLYFTLSLIKTSLIDNGDIDETSIFSKKRGEILYEHKEETTAGASNYDETGSKFILPPLSYEFNVSNEVKIKFPEIKVSLLAGEGLCIAITRIVFAHTTGGPVAGTEAGVNLTLRCLEAQFTIEEV